LSEDERQLLEAVLARLVALGGVAAPRGELQVAKNLTEQNAPSRKS
jgi:hypothetical protein